MHGWILAALATQLGFATQIEVKTFQIQPVSVSSEGVQAAPEEKATASDTPQTVTSPELQSLAQPAESSLALLPPAPSPFSLHGDWMVTGYGVGEFPVDVYGSVRRQQYYADHRLRLKSTYQLEKATIFGELDLLRGNVAGDVTRQYPYLRSPRDSYLGLSPSSIDLRQLYIESKTPVGTLRAGQMAANWGLGILANKGAGEADWGGARFHGDLVERVLFATRPFAVASRGARGNDWMTVMAADMVYRDQSVIMTEGDRAYQGVFAFLWAPKSLDHRAGVYAVRRTQTDRFGYDLNVWVFDAHAKYQRTWAESDTTLRLEAEVAQVLGTTNITRDVYNTERDVNQLGAAAELALSSESWEGLLQTGYAAGDGNPNDGMVTSFEFDPEYRVGFILFQEVLATQTASSAGHASNPDIIGQAAPGVYLLPTEGAVANAMYVAPTLRWNLPKDFGLQATVLWAQTAHDFIDPFTSQVEGGGYVLTSQGAVPRSRDLGLEADLGVRWTYRDYGKKKMSVTLQGGRFFPGAAFDAPLEEGSVEPAVSMDPIDRYLLGVNLYW